MRHKKDEHEIHVLEEILSVECEQLRLERQLLEKLQPAYVPITGVVILQRRIGMSLTAIAPGNSPQFQAVLQPVNAGPVVASQVNWSIGSYANATVTQNASDPTGLTATLAIGSGAKAGDSIALTVTVTNPDGTTATATDTLTVSAAPPVYVDVTGIAINQIV